MQKDSLVIGRGGSAAWVDVQVVTTARVSREHVRLRREPTGRFVIQDVSLWGTSVDGVPLPPAVKTSEGVLQPGEERELPPSARIVLAEAVSVQFEAVR
jgi:FtsP/CotA-like multicopper oxidase with cupredoxin domain